MGARSHSHNILVGGINKPLDVGQNYWTLIQESLDRAKTVNIMIINDIVMVI